MAIDLLAIEPNKVSRDLSGYITYIYGPGGAGKTTFGASCKNPLLLAFELGYKALPGVKAQPIQTWGEVKQVLRDLKRPEVKAVYSTIVVDTVDIAAQLCEKYLCNQLNIENIGDGGWATNGWAKVKREWEQTWRAFTMEGYAVVFISHAKDKVFKRKDGTEYNQIIPACPNAYEEIIKNMVDIMGYISIEGNSRKLILRSADDTVDCKSRFKMIDPEITFGYDELVEALNRAIDKEAELTNNAYVTDESFKAPAVVSYDFDALMAEFQDLVGVVMGRNQSNAVKLTSIVDKYLGKGKKVSDATPEQSELIYLIINDIKSDLLA
jgi:hypothetical protein